MLKGWGWLEKPPGNMNIRLSLDCCSFPKLYVWVLLGTILISSNNGIFSRVWSNVKSSKLDFFIVGRYLKSPFSAPLPAKASDWSAGPGEPVLGLEHPGTLLYV